MAEQKIVEKARKILVDELGYPDPADCGGYDGNGLDRKSTRLNSSHMA